MRCEDVSSRVADHLAGTLPADEAAALRAHANTCPRCRGELGDLEATWSLLGRVPAPPPDSAAMRARFEAELEKHQEVRGASAGSGAPAVFLRPAWRRHGMLAAAAVVLLALGAALGRATAPASAGAPADDVAALREELRDMRIMVGLALMQQPSASDRLKGVSWSGRIEEPDQELVGALLDTLMHDPNDNVRLATVDALRRFGDREMVRRGAIESLFHQRSPLVQIAIIDFAVETNDPLAVEALQRAAEDPALDEAVRARAARAVQRLG